MKNFLQEFWLVFKDFFTNFIFKKLTIQILTFQFLLYSVFFTIFGVFFGFTLTFFIGCIILSLILLFIEMLPLITMITIQNLNKKYN